MLVLVNNATRFTVAVYQVYRPDLDHAAWIIPTAIRNTLLAMNINPELVDEYFRLAGDVEFVRNKNRSRAPGYPKPGWNARFLWVTSIRGLIKCFVIRVGIPPTTVWLVKAEEKISFRTGGRIPKQAD